MKQERDAIAEALSAQQQQQQAQQAQQDAANTQLRTKLEAERSKRMESEMRDFRSASPVGAERDSGGSPAAEEGAPPTPPGAPTPGAVAAAAAIGGAIAELPFACALPDEVSSRLQAAGL